MPFTTTVRSRLLTQGAPVVGPGASVHASVMRRGLVLSEIVPLVTKLWPVAASRLVWSKSWRATPSKARSRYMRPKPWPLLGSVSFALAPVM